MAESGDVSSLSDTSFTDRLIDAQGINRRREGTRREPTRHRHAIYMPEVNMMCALGVPGNISHGVVADDFVDNPVLASVANGM